MTAHEDLIARAKALDDGSNRGVSVWFVRQLGNALETAEQRYREENDLLNIANRHCDQLMVEKAAAEAQASRYREALETIGEDIDIPGDTACEIARQALAAGEDGAR